MVKLTIREASTYINELAKLSQEKLPVRISYIIAKWFRDLKKETDLASEKFNEIQKEFAETDEDGNIITEKDSEGKDIIVFKDKEGGVDKLNKEYESLMETEVEFQVTQIKLSEVVDRDIKPSTFIILEKVFVDDSEAPEAIH